MLPHSEALVVDLALASLVIEADSIPFHSPFLCFSLVCYTLKALKKGVEDQSMVTTISRACLITRHNVYIKIQLFIRLWSNLEHVSYNIHYFL